MRGQNPTVCATYLAVLSIDFGCLSPVPETNMNVTWKAPGMSSERTRPGWDQKFVVYCDTPEQKQEIEARAKAAYRSVSKYVLFRALALGSDGEELRKALRLAEKETEGAHAAYRTLSDELTQMRKRFEELQTRHQAALRGNSRAERPASSIQSWESQVLQILVDGNPQGHPILQVQISLELHKTRDPTFVKQLAEYLNRLCDAGLVERVPFRGETGYRWRGPAWPSATFAEPSESERRRFLSPA